MLKRIYIFNYANCPLNPLVFERFLNASQFGVIVHHAEATNIEKTMLLIEISVIAKHQHRFMTSESTETLVLAFTSKTGAIDGA